MLLHYLGKLKIRIFCRCLALVKENANKLHFKCTNFNSSTRVTLYSECIYGFLSNSCSRHWIPCWLLTNTGVTSAVANFQCNKVIAKVNKLKNRDMGIFYLQSVWGKTRYFKHWKCRNLWMNNKDRGDKNAICLHFLHMCQISAENVHFSFPKVV